MDRKHNKNIVPFARNLRKNMTKEERHLWYDFLKYYKVRFQRQKVLGRFIADFYCAKAKIVIELDGIQHYWSETIEYDVNRTEYLEEYGLKVIRISNYDINNNFLAVCQYIDLMVGQSLSQLR